MSLFLWVIVESECVQVVNYCAIEIASLWEKDENIKILFRVSSFMLSVDVYCDKKTSSAMTFYCMAAFCSQELWLFPL